MLNGKLKKVTFRRSWKDRRRLLLISDLEQLLHGWRTLPSKVFESRYRRIRTCIVNNGHSVS